MDKNKIRRNTRNNGTFVPEEDVMQENEKIYDLENTVGHCYMVFVFQFLYEYREQIL